MMDENKQVYTQTTQETNLPNENQQVVTKSQKTVVPKNKADAFHWTRIIGFLIAILEVLLIIRFALKFLVANIDSPFVNLMYAITYPFVWPFIGIFNLFTNQQNVVEWSTLVAMLVYGLIGLGLQKFVFIAKRTEDPRDEVPPEHM